MSGLAVVAALRERAGQPTRRCGGGVSAPHAQPLIGIGRGAPRAAAPGRATPSPTRPTSCCCRCAACARSPAPRWRATASACSSFHDRDHGDGRADAWPGSTSCCAREGIADADGEVWLHDYPRVLGYVFKPVSFWYCHRADGTLAAIVVEVNNTFGERHCYLLRRRRPRLGPRAAGAQGVPRLAVLRTSRAATASASCAAPRRDGTRCVARIDHDDADGALLQTSLSRHARAADARAAPRRASSACR